MMEPRTVRACPVWPWSAVLAAILATLLGVGSAGAQSVTVTDIRLGQPGDRWLDTLQFQRLERATRDMPNGARQFGYAVTYEIPGHGSLQLFWPRSAIDFAGKSPHSRSLVMDLRTGRMWYPAQITARSLPSVHRGIVKLDAMYAADARGGMAAMEAFVLIASLGSATPSLRALPAARSASSVSDGRISSGSTTTTSTGPASTRAAAASASGATATRSASASRRALARALKKAGHVRPPESAAHHIVALNARGAKRSQKILARLGIGINEAANGVFLPATKASANPTGAAVHSTLHTSAYYEKVYQALRVVKTRADAESVLKGIRQDLLKGTF